MSGETFDVEICDDCLMVAANGAMGDGSEIPPEILHNPEVHAGGILTPTCGEEEGGCIQTRDGISGCTSFSWTPCDWCRRPLGGSRHAAVVTYRSNDTAVHTHECRDCGEGFDCRTVETRYGCPTFDGSCDACRAAS